MLMLFVNMNFVEEIRFFIKCLHDQLIKEFPRCCMRRSCDWLQDTGMVNRQLGTGWPWSDSDSIDLPSGADCRPCSSYFCYAGII